MFRADALHLTSTYFPLNFGRIPVYFYNNMVQERAVVGRVKRLEFSQKANHFMHCYRTCKIQKKGRQCVPKLPKSCRHPIWEFSHSFIRLPPYRFLPFSADARTGCTSGDLLTCYTSSSVVASEEAKSGEDGFISFTALSLQCVCLAFGLLQF